VVGRTEGFTVGHNEGRAVGAWLGFPVGVSVGAAVGLCVLVGLAELGWLVGRADTDGAAVGLLLGWAEGALEGCTDGT